MRLRTYGTGRPHDFSTNLRGGMVLLTALLLICTLMAGAVSADTEFNQTDFTGGTYTISSAGTYVLNATATGKISITAPSGAEVTVTAKANARLNGVITISTNASLTIEKMDILVNQSMKYQVGNEWRVTVIRVAYPSSSFNPNIILKDSIITFDEDVNTPLISGGAQVFQADHAIATSEFSGNTINNVTDQVFSFKGVTAGGTVTVKGNTVTMKPRKDDRALLRVWYVDQTYYPKTDVTYTVRDNVVSTVAGNSYKVMVVRAGVGNFTKATVKMTNNTLDGDRGSPYLYDGGTTATADKLKELRVNLTDEIAVLTPGLNQTGVKWNGGDVEITEGGNYQITHTESVDNKFAAFATMTISADNVFINGDDKQITLSSGNDKAILVNGASVHNVALKKLNITLESGDNLLYVGSAVTPLDLTISDSIFTANGDVKTLSVESSANPAVITGSIFNNKFMGNTWTYDVTVDVADVTSLKWNTDATTAFGTHKKIVPDQKYLAGNWWGGWSEEYLDQNGYWTLTVKDAYLPVADLAPLVNIFEIVPPYGTGIDLNNETQKTGTAKKFTATPTTATVTSWSSSNEAVLTIESDGNYTALTTGTTRISATTESAGKTVTATVLITVYSHTYTESDGNMENAFRVLFETFGGSLISPVTGLSYGDVISAPPAPAKDGSTFGGWYTDEACTQGWNFSDGIPGDMTLYARWIGGIIPTLAPTPTETTVPQTIPQTVPPTTTPSVLVTGEPGGTSTIAPPPSDSGEDVLSGIVENGALHFLLLLLFLILLLLLLLLRHTVIFLIPTAGGIERYRITVWHGKRINPDKLPALLRTAAWYLDEEREERWDLRKDRVTRNIRLYHG